MVLSDCSACFVVAGQSVKVIFSHSLATQANAKVVQHASECMTVSMWLTGRLRQSAYNCIKIATASKRTS